MCVFIKPKRLLACLDLKGGQVVKGIRFGQLQISGDPVSLANVYADQGVDELICLAIAARSEKRALLAKTITEISKAVSIPVTVGGGIDCLSDVKDVLAWGANKIVLGTAAILNPQIIEEAAALAPVILSIDVMATNSGWEVYSHGGRRTTGMEAVKWALQGQRLGASEILLTSIDRDGTRDGYDLQLLTIVCSEVRIPIIASGGAGRPEHLLQAIEAGAEAVLVASMLHSGKWTAAGLKKQLCLKEVQI